MTTGLLALLLGALGYGVLSALVPVVNAEAFVLAAAAGGTAPALTGVAGVTLGQTAGKVAIFMVVRKGIHSRFLPERAPRERRAVSGWRLRLREWSDRLLLQLERPWVGGGVVLTSAALGVPPLAVVAVLAGLRRTRLVVFVLAVVLGRLARFGVLALPVVAVAH